LDGSSPAKQRTGIMKLRPFLTISAIFFGAVAIIHAIRAAFGVPIVVGSVEVPMWPSWTALVLTGYLSFAAFRLLSDTGRG
jgi:hypothetical protein